MRRASTLPVILAAAGGLLLADAAAAQSGPRTLSWPGRSEATPVDARVPTAPVPAPIPVGRELRRPNPVIPHGGAAAPAPAPSGLTPAPGPARRTLTPANAWLRPAAPPPEPALAPAVAMASSAPPPAPSPTRPAPAYVPDRSGGQPVPAETIYPAAPPASEAAPGVPADPMAPRRDAPIFNLQRSTPPPAPATSSPEPAPRAEAPAQAQAPATAQPTRVADVANSGQQPPRGGARYYSVHRQNGREPDALVMPEPTYVDALVVSMTETPATQDLAEPDQGPTLIRDRNGNMRAMPAASDGDHQ